MFTGLIEQVGRVEKLERGHGGGGARLWIAYRPWETPLALGESVAVQGACLTVAQREAQRFAGDVLEETLSVTVLGRLQAGDAVNLERALPAGGRLGGHFVMGHVDSIGTVAGVTAVQRDWKLAIACDAPTRRLIVYKGSIAVDGVSLTVSAETPAGFEVNIIPHTWTHTTLHRLRVGHHVNLETDILGRYVARFMHPEAGGTPAPGVSLDTLAAAGFQ